DDRLGEREAEPLDAGELAAELGLARDCLDHRAEDVADADAGADRAETDSDAEGDGLAEVGDVSVDYCENCGHGAPPNGLAGDIARFLAREKQGPRGRRERPYGSVWARPRTTRGEALQPPGNAWVSPVEPSVLGFDGAADVDGGQQGEDEGLDRD